MPLHLYLEGVLSLTDIRVVPSTTPQFLTWLPRDPALAGVVAYYYVHFSDDENHESRFEYYPHYRNAVTAYVDADLHFNDFGSEVLPSESHSVSVLYTRNYSHSINVHIRGRFRKMGIAFEPLGVNHFIGDSLSSVAPRTVNVFLEFGSEFECMVKTALDQPRQDPRTLIEDFLVPRLRKFDCQTLHRAVAGVVENEGGWSVESLASELEVSRKTLLRLFKRHLCCTVEDYRKLVRFRNALNDYREQPLPITFTELAHKHRYYDQPAFIRHFKSVTGLTPRAFFAGLRQYGANDTYWSPR